MGRIQILEKVNDTCTGNMSIADRIKVLKRQKGGHDLARRIAGKQKRQTKNGGFIEFDPTREVFGGTGGGHIKQVTEDQFKCFLAKRHHKACPTCQTKYTCNAD